MGRCKLTLPFRDGLLITPVLRLATECAPGRVLVVLPPDPAEGLVEEVTRWGCETVTATLARQGQAESLKAGIKAVAERWPDPLKTQGVLVLLGDQPLVQTATVQAVLDVFAKHPECAVAAAFEGQRGHPVILPWAALQPVLGLFGDTGARQVLRQFGLRLVPVPDAGVVFDVDNPENYTALNDNQTL